MRGFFGRALAAFAGQAGQAAASVLLLVAIARAMPPAERGEFVLLTLLPQLGVYLVTLGLPAAALYYAARRPERRRAVVGLSLAGAVAAGVILTAIAPAIFELTDVDRPSLWVLLAGNTTVSWVIFLSWVAYGMSRYYVGGGLRTVPVMFAAAAVAGAQATGSVTTHEAYVWWIVPHVVLAAVSLGYVLRRYGIEWPTRPELREWGWYSVRGSATQVTNLVALRFDQWLLGALGTTAGVGVYSIAAALSETVLLVGRAVGVVVLVDTASDRDRRAIRKQIGVSVGIACVAAGVLAAIVAPLVNGAVGSSYEDAATLTQILLLGTPGMIVARLVSNALAGAGRPGRGSLYNMVAVVVTVSFDFLLIPSHGANGAAWASVIGYTSAGLVALPEIIRSPARDSVSADAPPSDSAENPTRSSERAS
ncbi:MAG TPA: polysaccharide biosynthesis C-terminal domain-containing protein [Thermoleophilaceae bacterium]|nr:polysaccharide biosynthesis C-terminal domain-containing protein [Thermoleophilaceae bacterium]